MLVTFPNTSVIVAAAAAAMALAPAAVLLLMSPAASAQTPARSVAIEVYVGDLSSRAGVPSGIGDRIEAAARSACAAVATRSPLLPREQSDCVRASVSEAMKRLSDQAGETILASAG